MPKISVIIPVYKVEQYVRECLDSILEQTFTDWECIMIDDGSPDQSGAICDEFAQKDSRFQVVHKENGGVTEARRTGLRYSHSEWITFVDSDDTLPTTALADFWDKAQTGKYSMVVGRFKDGEYLVNQLSYEEYRDIIVSRREINVSPWGRLIKKSLFDDKTLDIPRTIVKGEDWLMNIRLAFRNCECVGLINKRVYYYRPNTSSCIRNFQNSVDYEAMFYKNLLLSIPTAEHLRYMPDLIACRLDIMLSIFYSSNRNTWYDTAFFKQLMADINQANYPISKFNQMKLMTRGTYFFKTIKLCAIFHNFMTSKMTTLGINHKFNSMSSRFSCKLYPTHFV